jgi:D-ornithine 4,5-aminomutase subunit beta
MKPNEMIDINNILNDLEHYVPRRQGWTWRVPMPNIEMNGYVYQDLSQPLANSVPLPAAKYFNGIDPQPKQVITTEIASGRFEDDIRRMRMAAWHGADHIMVIRTAGQSHFDSLIEGTPQGIGGVPISRKQIRAQRKALDMIEDEVGRPINYHSYVSGVAGPEIAVLFAEEGVNGAHQDPQYNVLYRNINMVRSFIDAAESKKIMNHAKILQIDGAHNANATAKEAWKVMPELLVQHAINCAFSEYAGIQADHIALSTVPPTAAPAPDLKINLPYAVALRDFFDRYKMRAQMNTKYMESSTREATVTHVMNMMISKLTSADIQSTITPDEGRNVPWHMYNVEACDTAKQALVGMDSLSELVTIRTDGYMYDKVREIKERAILFFEELLEQGGYFQAVEKGFFIDSGIYPQRNGDGIVRKINGGIGHGTIYERDHDYFAPVTAHFGNNNTIQYNIKEGQSPSVLIGGCSFEDRSKIQYIDELDMEDNVNVRMELTQKYRTGDIIKPEVEWLGDGTLVVDITLPTDVRHAEAAALEIGAKMNLKNVEIIHREILHPAEATRIQLKGQFDFDIDVKN